MQPATPDILVRQYQPADRAMVRQICCDTADQGAPVENFFSDRELVADLLTVYYTDYEPQCTWIAESGSRVVGYLTGSLSTNRWWRTTLWRIGLPALLRSIGRGVLWRTQTWRFLREAIRMWRRHPRVSLNGYPAHLHVNVQAGFRQQKVGQQLMARFLEQVKDAALSGVHANMRSTNAGGRRFFERMGFTPLNADEGADTVVYGKQM